MTLRVIKGFPKLPETDKSLDPAKVDEYFREAIEITKGLRDIADDERPDRMHQSALRILSTAIWHPFIVQLARRKASRLMRIAESIDKGVQQLASFNGKLEGKPDLTSYVARELSRLDEARG